MLKRVLWMFGPLALVALMGVTGGGFPSRPTFQVVTANQSSSTNSNFVSNNASAGGPNYTLCGTGNAANTKCWLLRVGSTGALSFDTATDAGADVSTGFGMSRTGTAPGQFFVNGVTFLPVLSAIATTGQAVTSTTTLANDNALSLTLATGKYYQLVGNVNYTNASGGTGGGFKEGFTYSGTGGILLCNESTISSGAAASFVMGNSGAVFTAANTVLQIAPNGADSISGNGVSFVCVVYGGSAGGTLQFQIAQQVSNATATIRQNGSYFTATQLN